MTTPGATTPGAHTPTPTSGGALPEATSGYGGALHDQDAPDAGLASVHTPGQPPGQRILDGPAAMTIRDRTQNPKGKKSGKGEKKS